MLLFAYAKAYQSQRNDERIVVSIDCGQRFGRNPRIARLLR
ncbi:MAG TPA: hypothetical protein VGE07_20010 [Herpetosiphonaceae bacterium]